KIITQALDKAALLIEFEDIIINNKINFIEEEIDLYNLFKDIKNHRKFNIKIATEKNIKITSDLNYFEKSIVQILNFFSNNNLKINFMQNKLIFSGLKSNFKIPLEKTHKFLLENSDISNRELKYQIALKILKKLGFEIKYIKDELYIKKI
ncbi:MAG: hypothetical protein ACOC1P_01660, partial [Minisyncoccales bacterium]